MFPVIDKKRTGRRIRELMDARKITVLDVRASLALESTQSIYYWLNGRSLPSIDNLYALSQLLQVPMDDLVCGSGRRYGRQGGGRRPSGPAATRKQRGRRKAAEGGDPRMFFAKWDPASEKSWSWAFTPEPEPLACWGEAGLPYVSRLCA